MDHFMMGHRTKVHRETAHGDFSRCCSELRNFDRRSSDPRNLVLCIMSACFLHWVDAPRFLQVALPIERRSN